AIYVRIYPNLVGALGRVGIVRHRLRKSLFRVRVVALADEGATMVKVAVRPGFINARCPGRIECERLSEHGPSLVVLTIAHEVATAIDVARRPSFVDALGQCGIAR